MKSFAIKGAILALFGALTIGLGRLLGLELDQVAFLGVALGAVIGLVPDRSQTERIVGFLAGFVLAWIGYAVRAAVLPDTATGRATFIFLVIFAAMLVALASRSRLPLWSLLIGAAAMVGAYEQTYAASPALFMSDSPIAATTILFAAAMGVVAILFAAAMGVVGTKLLGKEIAERRETERDSRHSSEVST